MKIKASYKIALRIQLVFGFMLFFQSVRAQYFEFNWTEEQKYSNHKTGFFDGYLNANSSYVYVLQSNFARHSNHEFDKVRLVAYNKFAMTEEASLPLKGFPENKATKEQYETLRYFKTVIQGDRVIIFWTRLLNTDSTKTEELYAESYKTDLKPENKLKKVYELVQNVTFHQSDFALPSFVILSNMETGEVMIGDELHRANQKVVFEYASLNGSLGMSGKSQIELPTICGEVQNGIISGYDLQRDGNIYIRSTVTLSRDELRLLKPTDAKSFLVLTVLDPESRNKAVIEMRGENKTITDFSYAVTDTTARILGFFGDLSKDPTGIDKQGIFYADLLSDSLHNATLNYSYFEKTSLNKLFPKSRGGRKKTDVPSLEEQLQTRFDIENVFPMEDGSVVLFFTRKYNYFEITSRSGMDGRNIYKTDYYCEKNNVSAIRFTKEGKVAWTSNIERTITYSGTDIADVRVIYKFGKFYAMYGTEPAKPSKKKKQPLDLRDVLEYTTFDPVSGRAKKQELEVNPDKTPPKEKKFVDPNSIVVFDGRFYYSQMNRKQKPEWYAANVLVFPSIYYTALTGNTKFAKGELGNIVLMEGKPDRKKR